MAVATHEIKIDLTRDALLDDFTLQTLRERYLLPGETSPQEAFARASAAFADDAEHGQRLYEYVSNLWFMYATPLLSNGGSARGLPISCFLTAIEDSRESISEHYDEVIWLSSMGGGIGSYYGALRGLGEKTSKGSQSTGVIPFMAVDDRLILAVSQGGTRRGSNAVYLDIHHPEIREFITARKPTGGDHNRKITNLHNAVNVTDEFMIAVRDDTDFALRSPKTGEVIRMERARDLWRLLIETRVQTGEPYIHFIDTSNRHFPDRQKKLGLSVRQSNLCSEIMLGTGRDVFGKMRTAVCCLSSVNAEKWVEWKDHPTFIEDLMRMLDNCLQVFIDNAPDEMHRASYSAVRERSVGLGLLGFHSLLQSLDIPFESMAAETLNKTIFRHMRRKADAASLVLGAERGEAPDMEGSGERFAHKLAVAPNASSSILCGGASPSIEPNRANTFLHKTLSGSFQVKNRWLRAWLASLGADTDEVWKTIVANEGSIQHFSVEFFEALGIEVDPAVLDHKKRVYKTAMELDQRWVVRLAVGRTEDICQGQSLNVFHPHDATAETLSEVTFLAWNEGYGVKSMYYLRSTTPKRAENTNTKVERKQIDVAEEVPTTGSAEEAALLALNPTSDSTCVACEG
uniref:putative ribonucleoside diphosphate reductase alpha subunit n=1 Tax=Caulobacter phage CcrRogue TaxID=2927986 RepID=UPI00029B7CD4|nr:putative ribonucleoside diphosphate reductase alpha subunit [Caulobacter phage CcrRogue]